MLHSDCGSIISVLKMEQIGRPDRINGQSKWDNVINFCSILSQLIIARKYLRLFDFSLCHYIISVEWSAFWCHLKLSQETPIYLHSKKREVGGSGCGAVGRAVASDTRGPQFESSHWQNSLIYLFTVNCIEKTKIKKKEAGNGPILKKETRSLIFCCKTQLDGIRPKPWV